MLLCRRAQWPECLVSPAWDGPACCGIPGIMLKLLCYELSHDLLPQ